MPKTKVAKPTYDEAASLAALAKVGKVLAKPARPGHLETFSLSNLKLADLCKTYAQVKPYLDIALPLIAKVPAYGPQIVLALTLLMRIADSSCPVPTKA